MKLILILMCLISASTSAFALSKEEIKQSLNQMKQTGMFTEEQISAAEKKLMEMSQEDINAISKKGMEAAKDPEMQEKARKIVEQLKKQQAKP